MIYTIVIEGREHKMPRQGELKREFRKAGCNFESEGTNHEWWYSPMTGERFQMGRHDNEEIPKGTEAKLRKQAGVPKNH